MNIKVIQATTLLSMDVLLPILKHNANDFRYTDNGSTATFPDSKAKFADSLTTFSVSQATLAKSKVTFCDAAATMS